MPNVGDRVRVASTRVGSPGTDSDLGKPAASCSTGDTPGAKHLDRSVSPGLGRVTLRLPEPSHAEGDGLASDLTHAQSLSGGDTGRGGPQDRLPGSGATCRTQRKTPGAHSPDYRMPWLGRHSYSSKSVLASRSGSIMPEA